MIASHEIIDWNRAMETLRQLRALKLRAYDNDSRKIF